jgi:hypothetical protein
MKKYDRANTFLIYSQPKLYTGFIPPQPSTATLTGKE